MMESFFGRFKNEHIYKLPIRSKKVTKEAAIRWIETWYNFKRVHTSLPNGMAPMEYENHYWQSLQNMTLEKKAA